MENWQSPFIAPPIWLILKLIILYFFCLDMFIYCIYIDPEIWKYVRLKEKVSINAPLSSRCVSNITPLGDAQLASASTR